MKDFLKMLIMGGCFAALVLIYSLALPVIGGFVAILIIVCVTLAAFWYAEPNHEETSNERDQ